MPDAPDAADGGAAPVPGVRWPAEWEPHEATLLAWPHDPTTWPAGVEHAEAAFATLAAAIAHGEAVHVLAGDEALGRRARACLDAAGATAARIHPVATADAWIRDYGPLTVKRRGGERLALDFTFNAWGGKYPELTRDDDVPRRIRDVLGYDVRVVDLVLEGGSIEGNGAGTLLTTEQCLLDANRNPHLSRAQIEDALRSWLGVRAVRWLGAGIAGDDTDGHVDDITRFVDTRTVVTAVQPDPLDPDHAPLADNRRRLETMEDADGRPLEVVELPMPAPVFNRAGDRLPASHANFYVANAAVCVPVFGGASDAAALRTLGRCFPDRAIVPVPCEHLVEGLGALHCVTQQVPR